MRRTFTTEQEFYDKFVEYIKHCEDNHKMASIAGFAVYAHINRDTFYESKKFYPEVGGMIDDILEDYTLNADIHHVLKMFYLKCKFRYNDHNGENMKSSERVTIIDDLPDGGKDE